MNPKITFFMIVTDRDTVIADYAVKSYAKIKNIPFKLQVYSNWMSSALKQKHFPVWRQFDFVEIVENEWQTDDKKPKDPKLEGPFEKCATIWDRELKKITTPYHATVDADFEILDAKFIPVMLEQLEKNPKLVAISTDYYPTMPKVYDSFSNEVICLNERWNTWFCIYKREALQCNVSHAYYEEILSEGSVRRNAWDETGYFQKALKDDCGFDIAVLDNKYQPCFIHYGGFSKNVAINESNVRMYRQLQIFRKNGLYGNDILTKKLALWLDKMIFGRVDRTKYVDGWGQDRDENNQLLNY